MTGRGGRSIGAILAGSRLAQELDRRDDRFTRLAAAWAGAAGADCRRHTADLILKDGILRVTVDAKTWEQELRLRDLGELAARLAAATGLTIARIKVRTGATGGSTNP